MHMREAPADRRVSPEILQDGSVRIGERNFPNSVLIVENEVGDWVPRRLSEVSPDSLGPVLAAVPSVDLLIVGSDRERGCLDALAEAALLEAGVGYEIMTTNSAIRAWYGLLTDSRAVALGLIRNGC